MNLRGPFQFVNQKRHIDALLRSLSFKGVNVWKTRFNKGRAKSLLFVQKLKAKK